GDAGSPVVGEPLGSPIIEYVVAFERRRQRRDQDPSVAAGPFEEPSVDLVGPVLELTRTEERERPAHLSASGLSSASSFAPSSAATSSRASMSSASVRKFTMQALRTNRSPRIAFEQ